MDTVILAGGNGSRLAGITATGMKPFLVINGEAIISRLVRQAAQERNRRGGLGKIIVVTSPVNTQAMCSLLGAGVEYAVQPVPRGPGEALLRGLTVCRSDRVLVLMGDNHMADNDVRDCVNAAWAAPKTAIGVRIEGNKSVAERFTRVAHVGIDEHLISEEGATFRDERGPWHLWCGPLIVPRQSAENALFNEHCTHPKRELKIGPFLPRIMSPQTTEFVRVDARDIGVVEELV